MENSLKKFVVGLDETWNRMGFPPPTAYHEFVLQGRRDAAAEGNNEVRFPGLLTSLLSSQIRNTFLFGKANNNTF